jgi:hypothetical protein
MRDPAKIKANKKNYYEKHRLEILEAKRVENAIKKLERQAKRAQYKREYDRQQRVARRDPFKEINKQREAARVERRAAEQRKREKLLRAIEQIQGIA